MTKIENWQIPLELREKLVNLADKYENSSFTQDDPCGFLHKQNFDEDKEVVAFIASSLAFGRRDQIISHIKYILDFVGTEETPSEWIKKGGFYGVFPKNDNSFYRIFSNNDMINFLERIRKILLENKTIGSYFEKQFRNSKGIHLYKIICQEFKDVDCGTLIPKTENSSCKRIQLFLRWMVRDNSSVDLGLWNWFDKKDLIIPLDVHVLQEAVKFNLLPKTKSGKVPAATIKVAQDLTEKMKMIWPEDPLKGDFALFGLGVNKTI